MSFLHPLILLGLAAAAIPALLHLFERRLPPEVEFPPLRYLSEAERQSALDFQVTGPWPPYDFVRMQFGG